MIALFFFCANSISVTHARTHTLTLSCPLDGCFVYWKTSELRKSNQQSCESTEIVRDGWNLNQMKTLIVRVKFCWECTIEKSNEKRTIRIRIQWFRVVSICRNRIYWANAHECNAQKYDSKWFGHWGNKVTNAFKPLQYENDTNGTNIRE